MKTIYKKCESCDGKGYFPSQIPSNTTLPPNYYQPYIIVSEETKCHNCNGTGRIVIGYIDD